MTESPTPWLAVCIFQLSFHNISRLLSEKLQETQFAAPSSCAIFAGPSLEFDLCLPTALARYRSRIASDLVTKL